MTSDSPAPDPFSADDPQHLSRLRSLIERVIADGKITQAEADELRAVLIADGRITLDEMRVIRTVIREQLGDQPLEFE